jgi:two-component system copper resistance phosphate regulon response regulator CusR
MNRILIAEDEERITTFLEKGLQSAGYATEVVSDGTDALRLARSGNFDLLLLDLGLSGMDGIEVLRRLRLEGNALPVVILTARDSMNDTVTGLELGADDYITKPFRFDELLARVRARLRTEPAAEASVLSAGDLALDLLGQRAIVAGEPVDLSAREFALAEIFFRNAGQVLTREQLLAEVWRDEVDPGSNVVDVYVGYLRRKLGRDRITNIRGLGYRLEKRPANATLPGG